MTYHYFDGIKFLRAGGFNPRTMEIYRAAGVEPDTGPSEWEAERRPVAQFTVDQAYANFVERLSPQLARTLTIVPVKDYNAVIFGYRYASSAILSNGAEQKLYDDPYRPGGQPGMRAPHVELTYNDQHLSTVDLLNQHFVLLSGGEGSIWLEAARRVAEQFGIVLHAYRIGEGGDFIDSNGDFLSTYELPAHGAVLVRPDGFIGWKAAESGEQPALQLEQALSRLLSR